MDRPVRIYIYGDSLMKATMPDEKLRYHFHAKRFFTRFGALPVSVVNQSHFGATVEKGSGVLNADLERGLECGCALLEYGGNDCNYDWAAVADDPDGEHLPHTALARFAETLSSMADKLISRGIKPVLMTLPPIDGKKYLDFLGATGLNSANILKWLGDANMIYRFQELYSDAVYRLAQAKKLPCIDMRSYFLPRHDFSKLISADGIHMSEAGYELMFGRLYDILRAELA